MMKNQRQAGTGHQRSLGSRLRRRGIMQYTIETSYNASILFPASFPYVADGQ
jgi:hypothetical protein